MHDSAHLCRTDARWDCHRILSGPGLGDCQTGFPFRITYPVLQQVLLLPILESAHLSLCGAPVSVGTTRMESFLSGFTFPVLQQDILHPILGSAHLWSAMWSSPSHQSLSMSQLDSSQNLQNRAVKNWTPVEPVKIN